MHDPGFVERARRPVGGVVRRGQIWVGNLNPNRGREVGKVRPVLVIQADWLSEAQSRTVVVLPLSAEVRRETEPLRIVVSARDGLREDSQILVDQPRTLDRERIGEGPLATLSRDEMARVERNLLAVIGMNV